MILHMFSAIEFLAVVHSSAINETIPSTDTWSSFLTKNRDERYTHVLYISAQDMPVVTNRKPSKNYDI